MGERGQTFTLEALVAAVLLLATVAFALQIVSVSSNTASAAGAETRGQHAGLATGVLDEGAADGSLRATLVYWDEEDERFYDASGDGYYVSRPPPTAFGESLEAMFDSRRVRYDVNLYYSDGSGNRTSERLVDSGTPGDDAVRVTETVTLYNDTRLVNENGTERSETVADVEGFYAPDARPERYLYNVVRVEVVLWRT